MLAAGSYPQDYVDHCRASVRAQVAAYEDLAAAARGRAASEDAPGGDGAIDAFASRFFNTMVLVLEACFVHRVRNREGKDGNPLNEVRVLSNSLLTNDGVLLKDSQIKLRPETSVLGLAPGDEIRLAQDDFVRLADAFFAELEARYVEPAVPARG
jgi:hypothetical protein